jgi:2-oxoglutarate ferredoxin oxidoreductase subunit alpha
MSAKPTEKILRDVVIKFAGDSGDGMQLTGSQFTNNTAMLGIDLATFPDFPAEIRAPLGTLPGVSGFQLHFSSDHIFTPGDECDVLVAMNAAALKTNLKSLKKGGRIIANIEGFDPKNLRLANYPEGINPLEDNSLHNFELIRIDVTKLTRETLKDISIGMKEKDRAKNMFVLGFLYWMFDRPMEHTLNMLHTKFKHEPDIMDANVRTLKAGYQFGETCPALPGKRSEPTSARAAFSTWFTRRPAMRMRHRPGAAHGRGTARSPPRSAGGSPKSRPVRDFRPPHFPD